MLERLLEKQIFQILKRDSKVVVLLGPRQVGKTTLLKHLLHLIEGRKEILNGDYIDDQQRVKPDRVSLQNLVSHLDYLFIDEAQNIRDIGTTLKLIHDEFPKVHVMATGSSSFDLTNKTGEPLTGRQHTFLMYPISFAEQKPRATTKDIIMNHALLYGSYPETLTLTPPADKVAYLRQLVADYLLRDVYRQVDVNRNKLTDILRLIALQVGSEVSLNEISRAVQLDVKTVSKYLSFLEQAFVIFRLRGFSRNLRKEISKSQKIYFYDLGIRNALINAFNPLTLRDDVGKLWENFIVVERIKMNAYKNVNANYYFWRTYDGQEIDLIEERGSVLAAYECRYANKAGKIPALWKETYPQSEVEVVTIENFMKFIM